MHQALPPMRSIASQQSSVDFYSTAQLVAKPPIKGMTESSGDHIRKLFQHLKVRDAVVTRVETRRVLSPPVSPPSTPSKASLSLQLANK